MNLMKKKIFIPKKRRKYKSLLFLREITQKDLRILNFKRPKWRFLKSLLKKHFFRRGRKLYRPYPPFYFRQHLAQASLKWTRLQFSYKRFLFSKIRFFKYFELKDNLKTLKKLFVNSSSCIYTFLMKMENRLDIFLWRLGFFETPTQSRFFISKGGIWVNNSIMKSFNYVLKKGDLISVSPFLKDFLKKTYNLKKKHLHSSFIVCNFNTFEVILLADPDKSLIPFYTYQYTTFLDLMGLKNYLHFL